MYENRNRSSDGRSWSEWASGEWSEQISLRDALMFGAGAMLMLAAARMAPPFAMRAVGSIRGMTGTDPFDALAQDHQKALMVFDHIEATDTSMVTRRNVLLISPTVAYASTHSRIRGNRFSLVFAASSSLPSADSVACASRRARRARTRSICSRSSCSSIFNSGTGGSDSI